MSPMGPQGTTSAPTRFSFGRSLVWAAALVVVLVAGAVLARSPRGGHALTALRQRWREMHTPGSGRERVLSPDVLAMVATMRAAGAQSFRFTPALGNEIRIAPFLVEAAWPIECRVSDENIVGYAGELRSRSDCVVLNVAGELAFAHCHL